MRRGRNIKYPFHDDDDGNNEDDDRDTDDKHENRKRQYSLETIDNKEHATSARKMLAKINYDNIKHARTTPWNLLCARTHTHSVVQEQFHFPFYANYVFRERERE